MDATRSLVVDEELLVVEGWPDAEPGVIVGYRPGRSPADPRLYLGTGARLRSGTIIYAGSRIGPGLETGHHVVIREDNHLGEAVKIWNNTIDYGCRIGNRVKIHSGVYVAQFTVLEDDVFLAPGVNIANDPHPGCRFSPQCMRGPTIGVGAQIGAGVTILPFVTIGARTLVGAGSVVTRDLPPEVVAVGNPARAIRSIFALTCPVSLTDKPYHKMNGERLE